MSKTDMTMPCINTGNDIMQAIRLRAKILNISRFEKIINQIKCLDFVPKYNLFHWYYSDEILKTDYIIEKDTGNNEYWILGKIQVINNEFLISVNSIERAFLALTFFSSKIKKEILYFETADIHNKLLENNLTNQKKYINIETFFDNIQIVSDTPAKILSRKLNQKGISKKEMQGLMMKLMELAETSVEPEYENIPLFLYEEDIALIKSKFLMKQHLAIEHLKGNTEMNMLDLIRKNVSSNNNK